MKCWRKPLIEVCDLSSSPVLYLDVNKLTFDFFKVL